jgi:hypothetical protein
MSESQFTPGSQYGITLAQVLLLRAIDPDDAVQHPAFSHIVIEDWPPMAGALKIYLKCTDFPQPPSCGPVHSVPVAIVPRAQATDFLTRHALEGRKRGAVPN